MNSHKPILFFDGVCNLCNGVVDVLVRYDSQGKLMFASLQGKTAQEYLPEAHRSNLESVVLYDQGRCYVRSAAVRRVLVHLGGPWKLFLGFYILPEFILDFIYKWIARHRYHLFGKKQTCRVPSAEERARFLD
ncbi:MAG: DCC1-like thiol-disulfide oxidoreductase family protein [Bdellovibrionales bacterium]|nr:DCC1-like thiol-disulfide oxidoreductase family protein [Bdellovibrionales bacterium]